MPTNGTRRQTKQGTTIAAFLQDQTVFMSAQLIHSKLRDQGESIGLATVYRTLQRMSEDGDIDVVFGEGTEALYRKCSQTHHHHMLCRKCGSAQEIVADYIEEWVRRTAAEHNFQDVQHSIEVRGVCSECQDDEASPSRSV